ncbi:hypothetical protein ACLI09_09345 [Flavobacterium sp. RHBU_24]|uniref:hypothetical protein n=1 Tax=Flavobacterium sp. RHBU_24 TaxID=3391185 RepID=UPI003984A96F
MKTGILALACTALMLAGCKDKTTDSLTEEATVEETTPQPAVITGKQCFLQVTEGKADYGGGKTIRDSIIFTIDRREGDSIWGIFHWKPQEKDKKIANYKGTLSGTTGTVIANSHAEGMVYNEEVIFTLTDSAVAIKYGEMAEGKNGIWQYKDKNKTSEQVLDKVECK